MRPSVIDLTAVICFWLAIAVAYQLHMRPRIGAQTTASCSASLISGGPSYKVSGSVCLADGLPQPDAPQGLKQTHAVVFFG
jgi:hypothetical protein